MATRLNRAYRNMKARCYNPNVKSYSDYGAKGVTVCKEWLNSEMIKTNHGTQSLGWLSFKEWAIKNGYNDNLTIDRIDNNKGYSPENCRWVDRKVQANNRNFCRYITYKGKTQNLKQWCCELGLNYKTIHRRIKSLHWTIEKAFTTGIGD